MFSSLGARTKLANLAGASTGFSQTRSSIASR